MQARGSMSRKSRGSHRSILRNKNKGASRRKPPEAHSEVGQDRAFHLELVLNVLSLPKSSRERFASHLDEAVYDQSANYGAVKAYYVELDVPNGEVTVGLMVKKVSADSAQNMAKELLKDSLDVLVESRDLKNRPEVEETALSLA